MQAVETRPPLPPLISPFNLSLFPMTSKTFPQLPHWLHSVTQAVSSSPVMGNLCIYDRKKAKDESLTLQRASLCSATHSAHQWRALTSNSRSPDREGRAGKQSTTQGLLILSESVQFIQQRLVKGWFYQTLVFATFAFNTKVRLLS